MTLGQRIQAERTALGLSQEALGEQLGVSRQAVSKWEADAAVPDTDKLIALSKRFGMSLDRLLQAGTPSDPEKQEPAPPGQSSRNWKAVLAGALLLLLTALVVFQGVRLHRLEARLAALTLGGEAPEVKDFTFSFYNEEWDSGASKEWGSGAIEFDFDLIPSVMTEDMEVTFVVTTAGNAKGYEVAGDSASGHVTASGAIFAPGEPAVPITVTAVFADGSGAEYPAPLVRVDSFSYDPISYTFEPLWNQ